MTTSSRTISKFLVYMTIFLDRFGLLIVLPIFSTFLLYPEYHVFSTSASLQEKLITLGFLLASYPLAQFYGGPIFEQFSLRSGARNALILSMLLKIIGAFVTFHGIATIDLTLIFVGRLVSGFPGMNQSVALNVLERKELSQKKISYHSAATAIGFVAAIFLGGWFSDPSISADYSPALPLWILGIIYIVQLAIYLPFFPHKKASDKNLQINWLQCTKNIKRAFHTKSIRAICLIYFFIIFSWMTTLQFNSVYLIEKFEVSQWTITSIYLVMSVIWGFTTWIFDRTLTKKICPKSALAKSLGLMTFSSGFALFAPNLLSYYVAVALMAIFVAFAWSSALLTKFIRVEVKPSQNKSTSLSMGSLALALGPILLGFLLYVDIAFLHLSGAISALVALWIHQKYYKRYQN